MSASSLDPGGEGFPQEPCSELSRKRSAPPRLLHLLVPEDFCSRGLENRRQPRWPPLHVRCRGARADPERALCARSSKNEHLRAAKTPFPWVKSMPGAGGCCDEMLGSRLALQSRVSLPTPKGCSRIPPQNGTSSGTSFPQQGPRHRNGDAASPRKGMLKEIAFFSANRAKIEIFLFLFPLLLLIASALWHPTNAMGSTGRRLRGEGWGLTPFLVLFSNIWGKNVHIWHFLGAKRSGANRGKALCPCPADFLCSFCTTGSGISWVSVQRVRRASGPACSLHNSKEKHLFPFFFFFRCSGCN